jgi:hypothetical protein
MPRQNPIGFAMRNPLDHVIEDGTARRLRTLCFFPDGNDGEILPLGIFVQLQPL